MARRLQKTLIDYLVIAISPALIMLLVGSLVYFLIVVFYQGHYEGRLEWIFFWFVIGAVLIGRISIEDGRERAALFALPLAIAMLVVLPRFVRFGGPLAPVSFLVNMGLVAVVWWSADKLTWDCTLIDEQEEDSGEGLLETVGLDRPDRAALQREITPVAPEPKAGPTESEARGAAAGLSRSAQSATGSVRPLSSEATAARDDTPTTWWDRFVERRRRPHAPGVWVVYFSLAALPLFGIGQLCIPAGKPSDRQYAFRLLFVYTASALALLLSTSFLGLRRYLRQRQQEMPLAMVNLWLGIGSALIVAVMLLALLLPRPNAEYAISELPIHIGSPDQKSSRYGFGREGVPENQPSARGEQNEQNRGDKQGQDKQSGSGPPGESDKASSQNGQGTSKGGKSAGKREGGGAGKQSAGKSEAGPESVVRRVVRRSVGQDIDARSARKIAGQQVIDARSARKIVQQQVIGQTGGSQPCRGIRR